MARSKNKGFTSEPEERFDKVSKNKATIKGLLKRKIDFKPKTENQKKIIETLNKNQITFITGDAGTGKSFMAMAHSMNLMLDENNNYAEIMLIKSVTTLKGEEVGFLKGSLEEKFEPFLWSFKGTLEKVVQENIISQLFTEKIIKPMPLAFIRGMSIDNTIIIIEEAQNLGGFTNFETVMTRIGENSKMIFIGDEKQVDLKNKKDSFFSIITKKFEEKQIENIGVVRMGREDIVRNPLIIEIEKVLDEIKEEEHIS